MNLDTLARTVGDVADPTSTTLLAGRRRLDVAVGAATLRVAAVRRRRRWGAGALAGAAAALAAALVVPLVSAGPASAEGVLLAAADAAGQQTDAAAGAAYWHVVSEVEYPGDAPHRREVWQGRTGESVLRDGHQDALDAQQEQLQTLEERARAAADAANAAAAQQQAEAQAALQNAHAARDTVAARTEGMGAPATFAVGATTLTWPDLDTLPTDAAALGTLLRARVAGHESGEDNELWESVTGLLRESPASPALRRALWQVAATIPGVTLAGDTTDATGRAGVAIVRDELDQGWYRVVYVLDPADGTLLETRNVDKHGKVAYRMTVLDQSPAVSAPVADPPVCGPGSVPAHSC